MNPRLRRLLAAAVPVVGLVVVVAVLARFVDLRAAIRALAAADPLWLVLAGAMTLLAPVIVAFKLSFALRIVEHPAPFRRCWSAVLAAVTLNAVIPGRGGDLVRAAFLADKPGSLGIIVGAVLLERLVDVFTLGLLAGLASLGGEAGVVPWLAAGTCATAVGAVWIMAQGHRLPFKREAAERAGRAARRLPEHPGLAAGLVGTSLLSWANNVVIMQACLIAVGAELPALAVWRSTPVAILAGILPVTVSGIGTRDSAMVLLLQAFGQQEQIVAGAFGYTLFTSVFLALFGLFSLGQETLRRVRGEVMAGPRE